MPYLKFADSFPDSNLGWIHEDKIYSIHFSEVAVQQLEFLALQKISEIKNFILDQLTILPFPSRTKRIYQISEDNFQLAYRTWRIHYTVFEQSLKIDFLSSAYPMQDLENDQDPYLDKSIHREFQKLFNNGLAKSY